MRRNDLEDITIVIKKMCPLCKSTGFLDIPGGERTCPTCHGITGGRVEEEISLLQLMCSIEQFKQDSPLELTEGLQEVYAATAARLNPGRVRDTYKPQ